MIKKLINKFKTKKQNNDINFNISDHIHLNEVNKHSKDGKR